MCDELMTDHFGPHRIMGLFANMAPRNGRLDGHDEAITLDGRDFHLSWEKRDSMGLVLVDIQGLQ